ncbi:MAG: tetratricopeptide repeat protein [Spirochaetales bacterium]|nr:tetratricopeptide repeat protein [Spirochaetales bacterium]
MRGNRILTITVLILLCLSYGWAQNDKDSMGAESFSETLAEFRDLVYAQEQGIEVVQPLFNEVVQEIEAASLSEVDKYLWLGQAQFFYGRFFRMNNILDRAGVELDKAMELIDKSLAIKVTSEGCRIKTDIYGQFVAYKDRNYILKVGLKMRKLAEDAVKLDPSNGKAWLVHSYSFAFPPKIVGGDPHKALEYLDKAMQMSNIELDDLHNIYKTRGICYQRLGDKEQALFWLYKAKEIYPENWYILETIEEAKKMK